MWAILTSLVKLNFPSESLSEIVEIFKDNYLENSDDLKSSFTDGPYGDKMIDYFIPGINNIYVVFLSKI